MHIARKAWLAVTGLTLVAGMAVSNPVSAAPAAPPTAPATPVAVTIDTGAVTAAPPPSPARIRASIVRHAMGQVGKRETGVNNYPKTYQYNRTIVRPAEWCGVFVNWAWYMGGATRRPAMKHPTKGWNTTDQGHYATYWQKWGKANKRWRPISKRQVEKGDAVVYGNYPQSIAHIGVVVAVKKDSRGRVTHVKTVEGNAGDKVTSFTWRKIGSLSARGAKASGFVSPVAM
ncbi:hypothetical protein [Micromonospora sp. KC721]|uniref:hypothetical protein n=1 Tax=Micromonospora sp. KC721 TaxID=2530380 RepID=UPI001042A2AB|nr:hypothetical protein [Micromonospora sp. KC721]TDB74166.1 hypothetical protein E1182_19650 [Micromonospora sp. KC721]